MSFGIPKLVLEALGAGDGRKCNICSVLYPLTRGGNQAANPKTEQSSVLRTIISSKSWAVHMGQVMLHCQEDTLGARAYD
jgi:hypothetical protein